MVEQHLAACADRQRQREELSEVLVPLLSTEDVQTIADEFTPANTARGPAPGATPGPAVTVARPRLWQTLVTMVPAVVAGVTTAVRIASGRQRAVAFAGGDR